MSMPSSQSSSGVPGEPNTSQNIGSFEGEVITESENNIQQGSSEKNEATMTWSSGQQVYRLGGEKRRYHSPPHNELEDIEENNEENS